MASSASATATATTAPDSDRNFWVRYKIGIVNQRAAERSVWKEASICTRTWNNSVLQLMKVREVVGSKRTWSDHESSIGRPTIILHGRTACCSS